MKFSKLAIYIKEIEGTSSRLKITELLAALFKELSPDELDKTVYLLQGRVTPLYDSTEFGMGDKMVVRSVVQALNTEKKFFEHEYKKLGDLGETVEHFKKQYASFEARDLSIKEVYEELFRLAKKTGEKSQDAKVGILSSLIRQLDPLACKYLVRIPLGTLRLGFSDMTVLDSYSWMLKKDKTHRPLIEKAYHVQPDLGHIGVILKEKGISALAHIKPRIFTPIIMMRAERLSSGKEIIDKIGECSVEPKYDGFRLQAHFSKEKDEVRLYTRNLEEVSFMYPDVIEAIKKEVHAKEVILEGEAIGFDPNTQSFLPFQETVQRKRKYGIEEKAKEIPLRMFVFELLYLDGVSMLDKPFKERRKHLATIIKPTGDVRQDLVLLAQDVLIKDPKKLEIMFEDALSRGLEGIIAKKLTGTYQPGARASNWIKFKRSYSSKIDDTIDCLVMGYDFGKGKRTVFGIGAFLAGVYDEKKEMFVTVAKIGTGLTDEEWKELRMRSDKFKTDRRPALFEVDKLMDVDVWVKSAIIVEIRADEITRSPTHTAGRVLKLTKSGGGYEVDVPGYALRFPRLERFRNDKRPEDATTLQEVTKLYEKQKRS